MSRRTTPFYHLSYGHALFLLLMLFLAAGCSVKEVGRTVKYSIKGEHYLQVEDRSAGEESFGREVAQDPSSPAANYYYGRMLLRNDKIQQALPYLQKAVWLDGTNADYHFWTGAAHGKLNHRTKERQSYLAALEIHPNHWQALTYLGHNYLLAKEYSKALSYYQRAIAIWPTNPSALYNRALAMSFLKRTPEERIAWHAYLAHYPSGGLARKAVTHLNTLHDFSYRNYTLGVRTVSVEKISFEPFTAELEKGSEPSLDLIGTVAAETAPGTLQVIAYQKNNRRLAHQRARSIRSYLQENFDKLQGDRVQISWFDTPQQFGKTNHPLHESIDLFMTFK